MVNVRVKDLPCCLRVPVAARPDGASAAARSRPREPCQRAPILSDDFKLFATTFAAGFVFVSILFG